MRKHVKRLNFTEPPVVHFVIILFAMLQLMIDLCATVITRVSLPLVRSLLFAFNIVFQSTWNIAQRQPKAN